MRIAFQFGLLLIVLGPETTRLVAQDTPEVRDDRFELQLFAESPDIVTPVGATFDGTGRLLVIESHTHQRPKDYAGPEKDRIRIIEDTDGDGRADRFRTFFEGTESTMSLATGLDGWIYVATRMKVFRVRDTDGDGRADEQQPVVQLETDGNYPHNGLSGLALDGQGHLYFGIGENLGAAYRLNGRDGRAQSGSGEGGVFRCDLEGNGLVRIATGFWNPFGIHVDPHGRVFAVGNDADGRPPCRLVQVVETGDYGFQFRYGRSGRHPLQAWDGELPGTLPMMAGTGEAPCEITQYNGSLWVASWGHHRIESYRLSPVGASFRAQRETIVQGDESFRPVAFAEAPDGSLYFTDWVDRSYPVHGRGRVWRIAVRESTETESWPPLNAFERQAAQARSRVDWEAMNSDDPFLRQAAVAGLVHSDSWSSIEFSQLSQPRQRLGYLQALRWRLDHAQADPERPPLRVMREALADADVDVRLYAVRWVADAELKELRQEVADQLRNSTSASAELLQATIATIELLDTGKTSFDPKNTARYFAQTLNNETQPTALRVLALRMLPPDHATFNLEWLQQILASDSEILQREAVRSVVVSQAGQRDAMLLRVARDSRLAATLRADATAGLARDPVRHAAALRELSAESPGAVKRAADRGLRFLESPEHSEAVPDVNETQAWMRLVGTGGDPDEGWRVFFSSPGVRCADCHRFAGRGASTGPELTGIVARSSRERVLDSLLRPSREMAPQYVPTIVQTESGQVYQGLWQGYDVQSRMDRYQLADGTTIEIDPTQVEASRASSVSIMPDGLHKRFTAAEIRDLLALLE